MFRNAQETVTRVAAMLLPLLMFDIAQGQSLTAHNGSQSLTGFPPCDAMIAANLSDIVQFPSSPYYDSLVNGSWAPSNQRQPWCFIWPTTASEVSRTLVALKSAGKGAGDWHVAVRSGGHGGDNQNSITNGVIIDLTRFNTTTYDAETNIASVGTGSRWGDVYSALYEHGVAVTGGRQSVVGVGGLLLGGGVGWTTPRSGFGCDSVVNYEVVLSNGSIINANASSHQNLWHALKGGSSNFGIVTRFDIEAFPQTTNMTIERRTIGTEYKDQFIDAVVSYASLDQSFQNNAMVSVIAYQPESAEISMTVTEVNTMNDWNTTAFDGYNKIPIIYTSNKTSLSLPDVAAIDAPELAVVGMNAGAGPGTIHNDPRAVHYCYDQHAQLVADLNATLGPQNFSTILEFQPLPKYFVELGLQKGGNMLGLDRNLTNRLYFALGATLLTPSAVAQFPQVYQMVAATSTRIRTYAKSLGIGDEFIYLPYSDAAQDPLGSYGPDNVQYMKHVAHAYDPEGFFQSMVPGGFKIDRVV